MDYRITQKKMNANGANTKIERWIVYKIARARDDGKYFARKTSIKAAEENASLAEQQLYMLSAQEIDTMESHAHIRALVTSPLIECQWIYCFKFVCVCSIWLWSCIDWNGSNRSNALVLWRWVIVLCVNILFMLNTKKKKKKIHGHLNARVRRSRTYSKMLWSKYCHDLSLQTQTEEKFNYYFSGCLAINSLFRYNQSVLHIHARIS